MRRIFIALFFIGVTIFGANLHMALASEKVTVVLDWFVNPDHGPLYVAFEKGGEDHDSGHCDIPYCRCCSG